MLPSKAVRILTLISIVYDAVSYTHLDVYKRQSMMYTIRVSDGVDKVIAKWKKSNPNLFKKYKKIYKELLEPVSYTHLGEFIELSG